MENKLSRELGPANWVHFYPLKWIKKGIFLGGDTKDVGVMMHINGDTYPYWKNTSSK
jgi:hypothetical protein